MIDSSFTIKPRDTVSRVGIGRTGLVRTDLAPSQSVSAAKPAVETHVPLIESAGREPVINPQAQALLSREQEERLRRATHKAADEALLGQRAYGQAAPHHATPHDPDHDSSQDPHADIEA
jgi:hypothetical protein